MYLKAVVQQTEKIWYICLLTKTQGAFMRRTELSFNMLLCQELARGYSRKHISFICIMKIDLKKAYDSMHWGFLREMLTCLHFPETFIARIMASITTTTFTISMSVDDFGYFEGGRGLRQGDSLPRLLFVLIRSTYLDFSISKQSP